MLKVHFLNRYIHIFVIVFFEFFGTLLFAYANFNLINAKANARTDLERIMYFFVDFSLSMFMCISYGRQFSGALYNPAVVMFRFFRRTERYPIKIGLLYMLMQFLGGIGGSYFAIYFDDIRHAPIVEELPKFTQIDYFFTEMYGTVILTFMVQVVTEKRITFIQHNRQFYICLPLFFLIARTYSSKSNGINPAFGLGFQLAYSSKVHSLIPLKMSYILIAGPLAGAVIAALLFQYGYKPLFPMKKEEILQKLKMMEEKRKQKDDLELQEGTQFNRRWSLAEVAYNDAMPDFEEESAQFTMIAQSEYDDEIDSIPDQQEREYPPYMQMAYW